MNIAPDIKVGRRVGSPSARTSTHNSIHNDITISVLRSAAPAALPPGAPKAQPPTPEANTEHTAPTECTEHTVPTDGAVELLRCPVKNIVYDDFVVDVKFLKHVIHVILSNHHISTDANDLRDILSYYGEVDMRTSTEIVKTRGVKKHICSNVDVDDVIEIVQKILVNGVNIAKRVPELVEYIQQLGITL
jgi:hypothetical protein